MLAIVLLSIPGALSGRGKLLCSRREIWTGLVLVVLVSCGLVALIMRRPYRRVME